MDKNEFSNFDFWFGNEKRFLWNGQPIRTRSKTQKIRYPNINFRMFKGFSAKDFKPIEKKSFDKLPELIKEAKKEALISGDVLESFYSVNDGNNVFRTLGKEFFALVSAKNWSELSEIRKRSPVFNFDYEMAEVVSKTNRTTVAEFLKFSTAERISKDPSLVITLIPETEVKDGEISTLATPVFESNGIKYYDPALLLNKELGALPPKFEDSRNGDLALEKDGLELNVVKKGKVKEFVNILGNNLKIKLVEDIEDELEEGQIRIDDRSFLSNVKRQISDKVKQRINKRQNAIEKYCEVIYSSKGDENAQVYSILKNVASLVSKRAFEEIETQFQKDNKKHGERLTYLLPPKAQYDEIAPQIKDAAASLIAAQLGIAFLKDKDDAQTLFEIFELDMMKSLAQIDKSEDAEWIIPMIGSVVSVSLNNAFANVVNLKQFRYSENSNHNWANTRSFLDIMFQKEDVKIFEGIFDKFRPTSFDDLKNKLTQDAKQKELERRAKETRIVDRGEPRHVIQPESLKKENEETQVLDLQNEQLKAELKKLVLCQVRVWLELDNEKQSNEVVKLNEKLNSAQDEQARKRLSGLLSYQQYVLDEHKTIMESIKGGIISNELLNNVVDGFVEACFELVETDESVKNLKTVDDFYDFFVNKQNISYDITENNITKSYNVVGAMAYFALKDAQDLAFEKLLTKIQTELDEERQIFDKNTQKLAEIHKKLERINSEATNIITEKDLQDENINVSFYKNELNYLDHKIQRLDSLVEEQENIIDKKENVLSNNSRSFEDIYNLFMGTIEEIEDIDLKSLEYALTYLQQEKAVKSLSVYSDDFKDELKLMFVKDLNSNISTGIFNYINDVNVYFKQNNITQNNLEAKYENSIVDNMRGYQNSIKEDIIENKWLDELVDQTLVLVVERAKKDKILEVKNIQEFYDSYCKDEVSKTWEKVKEKSTYTAQVELLEFKQEELKLSDYTTYSNNKKILKQNIETVNKAKLYVNQITKLKGLKNGDELFVALRNEINNLAKQSSSMQTNFSYQQGFLNEKRDALNKIEKALKCETPNQKQIEKVFPTIFYFDPLRSFKELDKTKLNKIMEEVHGLKDKRQVEKRERDWAAVAKILKSVEGKDLTLAQTFDYIEKYKKGKTQTAEDKQNIKDLLAVFNYVSFVGDKALDGEQRRIENLSPLEQKLYKDEDLKQFKELQEWLHIENNFKRIRSHSKKIGVYEQSGDKHSEEALKINEIYFDLTKKIIFAAVENQAEKDYSAKKSSKEISKHYLTKKEVNGFSNSITNEEVLKRKLQDYLPKFDRIVYNEQNRYKQLLFDVVCSVFDDYNVYDQDKVSYLKIILKQAILPGQVTKAENNKRLELRGECDQVNNEEVKHRKLDEADISKAEEIKEVLLSKIIEKLGDCLKLDDEINQTDLTKEQKELKRSVTKTRKDNGFTLADLIKLDENSSEELKALAKEESVIPTNKQNSKTKIAKEIVNRVGIEDLYTSSQKLAEKYFAKERRKSYENENLIKSKQVILDKIYFRDINRKRQKNNYPEHEERKVTPYLGEKELKLLDDKDKTLL